MDTSEEIEAYRMRRMHWQIVEVTKGEFIWILM